MRRQLACFASRISGGISAVSFGCSIDQLPHYFTVYRIALRPVAHHYNHWDSVLPGYQFQCPVCSQAHHLAAFLARHKPKFPQPGVGYLRINQREVKTIPIPKHSPRAKREIVTAVDKIIAAKRKGAACDALEARLDEQVAVLYGLTSEEVLIINERRLETTHS